MIASRHNAGRAGEYEIRLQGRGIAGAERPPTIASPTIEVAVRGPPATMIAARRDPCEGAVRRRLSRQLMTEAGHAEHS